MILIFFLSSHQVDVFLLILFSINTIEICCSGKGVNFFKFFLNFIFFSSGCRLLILILFPSTPSRSLVLGGWGWLTQSGMARPAQGSPLVKYPRWGGGPVARSKYWIWRLVNNLRRVVSIQLLYFTCVWYGLKSLCLVWCLVLSRPPQIVVVICPFNLWLYNSTSLT